MRQLSPPLRHPSDSEVGSLFSLLLLLRLALPATGTRVKRSRIVTDGRGAVGGERISGDDGKLLLLFEEKTSAGARGSCTKQSTSGPQMRKKTLDCSCGAPASLRERLIISHCHHFHTKTFPEDRPASHRGGLTKLFLFRRNAVQKNKQINKKNERNSRHEQINSRQAAFRLWAR